MCIFLLLSFTGMKVANQEIKWKEGECVIFDDCYEVSATTFVELSAHV